MASAAVMCPCRSETADVLEGARLRDRLLELFDRVDRGLKKKEKKKPKKKGKMKEKSKPKQRDKSPDKFDFDQLTLELHGNPSSYLVFANVRNAVLEHQVKQMSHIYQRSVTRRSVDSDSDDDGDDKSKDVIQKVPKIVAIGLCGMFELVKETQFTHPQLCCRALKALLNILQGQHPEALKYESPTVIESLYHLLLDLSTVPVHLSSQQLEVNLTSLACACLLSLVVARGDTSEILGAVAGLLMSPSSLATQMVEVPSVLTSLQKSVHAMLLGRSQLPEWLSEGIRENSKTATIRLDMPAPPGIGAGVTDGHSAIASDGRFLYIHNVVGLHKVGSGYGGTVKGLIHLSNHNFPVKKPGWLAYAMDRLFFKAMSDGDGGLQVIDTETLEPVDTYQLEGAGNHPNVLFSDGQNLGHIAAAKDDSFVVRSFNPERNPCPLINELSLKLARKCVKAFGTLSYDQTMEIHNLSVSSEEDVVSVNAGKEFAIVRTAGGKVLYTGKSTALGIKQGGPAAGKWAELPITKSPKVVQVAVGHDGQHVLLVSEDGSVFFAGTPRRGEDADGSVAKGRRQPKSLKPKKMIQLESHHVVAVACNSGTSAVVTREGEVFMYGKDTAHCDPATGQLSELRDVVVTSIALGKAHGALLTSRGHVYTFGINNKGQCGRDFVSGAAREMSVAVTMADEEEDRDANFVCAPGTHMWKHDQCMVCTSCGECTGYGSNCVNAGRSDRNPGQPCSCGPGDAGCTQCGVCRACAGDPHENEKGGGPAIVDMANGGLLEVLARSRDIVPLDPLIERLGVRYHKVVGVRRVKVVPKNNLPKAIEPQPGEAEQEHVRVSTRSPASVELGRHPAIQVTCGLHHTVVLLGNGEVYTFGGNMYGQLGHGDIGMR
ncbi:hypothetical protein NP493_330g03060 [Ridgeia piscesae]|uniref:E3 ubiquitin-protein ligase MYCBP2 n=1 Tax=Ridgeia piscesae TaxID=27915 RepID=A0AAD9L5M5_RIDPI|nr:hypothetical protein NP493_330g03060 [Ridgeia piscesae]